MKSKSLVRAALLSAASLCFVEAPGLAQAPSKALLDCYGVCNRTVPNQQKRNDCFRACRGDQAPAATMGAATKSSSGGQTAKPATTGGDLTACYGVCNRTVPDQKKRNACFQACRTGQGSGGTRLSLPTTSNRGELDAELEIARTKRSECIGGCYGRYSDKAIDERRRCEDVCYGQHQARSNAAYDRDFARNRAAKAAATVPAGNCQKGCEALHARYAWEAGQRGGEKFPAKSTWVPACVARCSPAMPACQEALAILRGAKSLKPGTAGFLGQSRIELWEAKLRGCSNPDQDTLQVANEIRREWKASLEAPRYVGE